MAIPCLQFFRPVAEPPPCHPKPERSPFSFWMLAGAALLLWATFAPPHVDACVSQQRPRLLSDFSGFPRSPLSVRENFSCFSTPVIRSGLTGKCFYLVTGQLSHSTTSSEEPELVAIIVSGHFCKSSTTTWRKNFKRVWIVAL